MVQVLLPIAFEVALAARSRIDIIFTTIRVCANSVQTMRLRDLDGWPGGLLVILNQIVGPVLHMDVELIDCTAICMS